VLDVVRDIRRKEDDMTTAFAHVMPWTEEEYLALGETPDRVELFDGSLFVSPAPTPLRQRLARRLANVLEPPAQPVGLEVYLAVNLRLKPGRIPIPDLVVTVPIDIDQVVQDAASVVLVAEIISPNNAATDRVLKMHYYAEAGIEWYLLVEPDAPSLRLHRLEGSKYLEYASAEPGTPLRMDAPVKVDIDPVTLLSR
jgi:Uma2 family endonuclease